MQPQRNFIEVTRTAQYFSLGTPGPDTASVWLVCHGYGQLPEYFIRHFESIANASTYIVAPEGLSKFYLEGFSGRVGASWMTSDNRENEIRDYTAYLEKLYRQIDRQVTSPYQLHLLGFSQGVATACRWLTDYRPPIHQLVLWAGLPPDGNTDLSPDWLHHLPCPVTFVYGEKDPFFQPGYKNILESIRSKNDRFNVLSFDGKHELDPAILQQLARHPKE